MGYRSEVVLAVSKQAMPHFLAVLAKMPEACTMVFKDHDKLEKDYDGKGTMLVAWDGIKWYDSYPEIRAIEEFLEECELGTLDGFDLPENDYQENHVRFVRLGEDMDDCDVKGALHEYDINFCRSLSY